MFGMTGVPFCYSYTFAGLSEDWKSDLDMISFPDVVAVGAHVICCHFRDLSIECAKNSFGCKCDMLFWLVELLDGSPSGRADIVANVVTLLEEGHSWLHKFVAVVNGHMMFVVGILLG